MVSQSGNRATDTQGIQLKTRQSNNNAITKKPQWATLTTETQNRLYTHLGDRRIQKHIPSPPGVLIFALCPICVPIALRAYTLETVCLFPHVLFLRFALIFSMLRVSSSIWGSHCNAHTHTHAHTRTRTHNMRQMNDESKPL